MREGLGERDWVGGGGSGVGEGCRVGGWRVWGKGG